MRKTATIWIIYALGIISVFFMSSCSHSVVNGVRIKEKKNTQLDKKEMFYMTVSFWLGFGVTHHFFNPRK